MKITLLFLLISVSLFLFSCKKSDNPVSPDPPVKTFIMSGYGTLIDSNYFKIWSDSSWEKYNRYVSINGNYYITLINNTGDEYYYSTIGYSGFKSNGQSLIMFDKPITGLPDTVSFNQTYSRSTTFYYQGYNYTFNMEYTLLDTTSVYTSFANFNSCLHTRSKGTISVSTQTDVQTSYSWIAKGPSDIKQTLNSGSTISMARGIVNGKGWGMPLPKIQVKNDFNIMSKLIPNYQFRLKLIK
jgi:hypothetical protein